ncbi:site-2 protease family protein [candidate division WOR-3 bacterium]|uniref:Site-2 protease family protein n=1 Tax=candidate division WOR-3 bacterium TaxID=2052148 RepID=A0A660SJK5_UNCW3|nr:MAG: site-2 protease family protein [candidate division WOR-3 bacterium]
MEELISQISLWFTIDEISPGITHTRLYGSLTEPKAHSIERIKEVVAETPYFPIFTTEEEREVIDLIAMRPGPKKRNPLLNLLLFLATVFTTMFVGSRYNGGMPWVDPKDILLGIPFSLPLMAILTSHELGHYFTSRRFRVFTSLPYFLPIPLSLFGTLGAIIKMDSVIPNRKALFWIGLVGPLTGFLVSIPIIYFGLKSSRVEPIANYPGAIGFGNSLLFWLISRLTHPVIPEGMDIILHPMAFAGWVGLFVTGINLIPMGQLDGGHIAYSILLKNRRFLSYLVIAALAYLGIHWIGWYIWLVISIILGMREPLIQDRITPLPSRYRIFALIPLTIFALSFIPIPFFFNP